MNNNRRILMKEKSSSRLKTPGELFLEEMKVKLANMSNEEFLEEYNKCEQNIGPTVKEFCEWNNIPYKD